MELPAWLGAMDRGDEELLDRAYARRHELLAQPETKWVRMTLEARGVTFVLEERSGAERTEWMARQYEPADSGSGNGAYDRE
jgi:hypothetical protein